MKYFIPLAFLFCFLFSCSNSEQSSEQQGTKEEVTTDEVTLNENQFKTAGIETGLMENRSLNSVVKANGVLDVPPQNMVSISAPLGGFVKATELLQGMKVKKGQTLVVMEHPDYIQLQQDYLEAKSQVAFLETEYQRQQELSKENVTATKTFQQTEANYKSSKAKVEALLAKLRLIHIDPKNLETGNIQSTISIPSPIEGFVTRISVNRGSYVNPTDVMFQIVDTEHLHAEAEVFEKDIFKLKIGQRVLIRLANETVEREAKVYLIGKEISSERTVRIHCHLQKEDVNLLPGMYFSAIIETTDQSVPALPENAIVNFEGKDYVFLVIDENNRSYKMKEIKRGVCEDGFCEVTFAQPTDARSKFVFKGAFELLSLLKNSEEEE